MWVSPKPLSCFPTGPNRAVVRYFAPLAEVAFCGHATIATAVALAQRSGPGEFVLDSNAGPIQRAVAGRGVRHRRDPDQRADRS